MYKRYDCAIDRKTFRTEQCDRFSVCASLSRSRQYDQSRWFHVCVWCALPRICVNNTMQFSLWCVVCRYGSCMYVNCERCGKRHRAVFYLLLVALVCDQAISGTGKSLWMMFFVLLWIASFLLFWNFRFVQSLFVYSMRSLVLVRWINGAKHKSIRASIEFISNGILWDVSMAVA